MDTDNPNISGKVVVITGASSGLGEATARYLADRAGHHRSVGSTAAKDRARPCDVHRRSAVRRCVEAARVVATRPQPGATGKPAQLAGHLGRALNNGVQPSEASGLLAHLAIYCGWPSAVSALDVYEQVYTARTVDTAALRAVGARLPAPVSDAARARAVTDESTT
jgi:NAD(P)-dependent dehydrogenase (short-subunit alcohol dehydrogenase family)